MTIKLLPEQLRFLRNRDRRLVRKYERSSPIVAKVGHVAYKVEPPQWMKIHPVLHVSRLKPYYANETDDSRNKPSRPAVSQVAPLHQGVEEILAERVVKTTKHPPYKEYLVKWKGLNVEKTNWERVEPLTTFPED